MGYSCVVDSSCWSAGVSLGWLISIFILKEGAASVVSTSFLESVSGVRAPGMLFLEEVLGFRFFFFFSVLIREAEAEISEEGLILTGEATRFFFLILSFLAGEAGAYSWFTRFFWGSYWTFGVLEGEIEVFLGGFDWRSFSFGPPQSFVVLPAVQCAEAKLGRFHYNNKLLYFETRLILILRNKQQNKKIDAKQ